MKRLSKSRKLIPAHKLIFFILLFFLPQQFGPHFWPPFSYVHGIRVDYLSPSIYVSDLFLIVLFLLSYKRVFTSRFTLKFISSKFFILFLFVLLAPLFFTKSPLALLYGLLKLFELGFLGLFVASQIKKRDLPQIVGVLAFTGFLEATIAFAQFFKQGSVGGFLYFFGERQYSLSTVGAAVMNTASGLMVRSYGTFPHPNVLAFFLFTVIVIVTYRLKLERNKRAKLFLVLSFALMQFALLLTFSRVVIFLNVLFLVYVLLYLPVREKIITRKKTVAVFVFSIFFTQYLLLFNLRFFDFNYLLKDLIPRSDLNQVSFSIVKIYPTFGIGLNNFFYYSADIQMHFSSIYLQPVHNIFLLLTVQTGVIGSLIFGYFLLMSIVNIVKSIKKSREVFPFQKALLILLISIIIAGMFDHYFLTIQQSQLLLALTAGMCWNRSLAS